MGDLDDSPGQPPLTDSDVQQAIISLLPGKVYDLLITHSPHGEYTRHLRHEETSRAVCVLWEQGEIISKKLWLFAYEDGAGKYLPRPIEKSHKTITLPEAVWREKYRIITNIYGFSRDSFEARVIQKKESFWCFHSPLQMHQWLS